MSYVHAIKWSDAFEWLVPSLVPCDCPEESSVGFRLSVSQLPAWAQRKVVERPSIAKNISAGELNQGERGGGTLMVSGEAQGRWAQVREMGYGEGGWSD